MIAARERERAQRDSQKAYAVAMREMEAARVREARDRVRAEKASTSQQLRLEKEARISHEAAMMAEAECLNLKLAEIEYELTGILDATLGVDDFVDLNTLRVCAEHPPFDRQDLKRSSRPPLPIIDAPMPQLADLPPPRGVMSIFRKKAHEKAKLKAAAQHEADMIQWRAILAGNEVLRQGEAASYNEREKARVAALQVEENRYAVECARREQEAEDRNREVDELIANLGYGTAEAIEEYIGIVLSNAVYPDHFPIGYSFSFDPAMAELRLSVAVIPPDQFPTAKSYKYTKSSDEITTVPLSQKACKDRYSDAINQVSLRVPHEIFEADRRGLIASISLQVGTNANDPATGISGFVPLVALGVARETFLKLDLANVLPAATLAHLGASVSKNAFGLVPANASGVRRS